MARVTRSSSRKAAEGGSDVKEEVKKADKTEAKVKAKKSPAEPKKATKKPEPKAKQGAKKEKEEEEAKEMEVEKTEEKKEEEPKVDEKEEDDKNEEVKEDDEKKEEEKEKEGETEEKPTVTVEACKQWSAFKTRANKIAAGLGVKALVKINPEKPGKGNFVVRVVGVEKPFVALLGMARPFKDLKALNVDKVVEDILKAIES